MQREFWSNNNIHSLFILFDFRFFCFFKLGDAKEHLGPKESLKKNYLIFLYVFNFYLLFPLSFILHTWVIHVVQILSLHLQFMQSAILSLRVGKCHLKSGTGNDPTPLMGQYPTFSFFYCSFNLLEKKKNKISYDSIQLVGEHSGASQFGRAQMDFLLTSKFSLWWTIIPYTGGGGIGFICAIFVHIPML